MYKQIILPGWMMGLAWISIGICAGLLAGCVSLPAGYTQTAQVDVTNTPIPQIDSGGHGSLIRDIAFTKDGRYLVSAGDDKLVRVWDVNSGKTVRTIRGQINQGDEGKIYAMALSPDNRYLAVGGWMKVPGKSGHKIRLYDFASGKLLALLKGHTNVVNALAFSADSRWLVSGQGGSSNQIAIVWDIHKRQQHQILPGHTDPIYAVAFTPDNQRVVTGSNDHTLKLWQRTSGKLIKTLDGHEDDVSAIAVTPAGEILSGGNDHSIRRWDGRTGESRGVLVADQGTHIGSLSVSADGRYVLAGVTRGSNTHLYRLSDGQRMQRYQGHDNAVLATAFSPNGRLAATAGGNDRSIHLWDINTGQLEKRLAGDGKAIWAVGFSADGQKLAWGKTYDYQSIHKRGPLEYQLQLPSPTQPLTSPQKLTDSSDFLRAQPQHGQRRLNDSPSAQWGYSGILEITANGSLINKIERDSTDGYRHRAYTFTPNGKQIISGGSNGALTLYDQDGDKQGDFVGHTGDIWSVAVSPDGRLLASGSADQTVRLWRIKTRELLLSVFQAEDGEWVAWTPQGYYASSVNGDQMIGWQINRGVDKAADYANAAQLRKHFYRPDIVDNTIRLGSAKKATAQAANTDFVLADLLRKPLPKFRIVAIEPVKTEANPRLRIRLKPENRIEDYRVLINGVQISNVTSRMTQDQEHPEENLIEVAIPGLNKAQPQVEVQIVAKNPTGEFKQVQTINLPQHLFPWHIAQQGDLYLVAVGVSDYEQNGLASDLNFAAKDALAFYQRMQAQAGKDYRKFHGVLLSDDHGEAPSAANIMDALALFEDATEQDTVMLFLAGHGRNERERYYFLPRDAQNRQNRLRRSSVIDWIRLQTAMTASKGRRILLLDTCHAANAFNQKQIKTAANENIFVIAATPGNRTAEELEHLRHGVFTYALLKALSENGDVNQDGEIRLHELRYRLTETMEYETQGRQTPVLHGPLRNFVFARL